MLGFFCLAGLWAIEKGLPLDDSSSMSLILILLLIALGGMITLIHSAIVNVRMRDVRDQSDDGDKRAHRLIALLDAKSRLTMTYNLMTTIIYFLVALVGTIAFVVPAMQESSTTSPLVGVLIVLLIGVVTLLMGSIVPEGIGSAYANTIATIFAPLMLAIVLITSPLTWVLLRLSRFIAGIFGGGALVNTVTEEEIMTLVNAGTTGGTIEDEERAMIYSVLQLDETNARELMTPRIDIISVEVDSTITDALSLFIESGYSRIPVYEENIDNIVGLLYAKDLLNLWRNGGAIEDRKVRDYVRPAHFVPETIPADELLRDLRARNVHMVIVVDEYGGTSGLVTIENLIEEIVGDIRDEYDVDEEAEYIQISELEYICDASMDLDDINDLMDLDLDSDETDTLGGWVYYKLGRVPDVGDTIDEEDYTLIVNEVDGRRIRKVLVVLKPEPTDQLDNDTSELTEKDSTGSDDDSPNDDEPHTLMDAS